MLLQRRFLFYNDKTHYTHIFFPIFPPTKRENGIANAAKNGRNAHSSGSADIPRYKLRSTHVSKAARATVSYKKNAKPRIPFMGRSEKSSFCILMPVQIRTTRNGIPAGVFQKVPMARASIMQSKNEVSFSWISFLKGHITLSG